MEKFVERFTVKDACPACGEILKVRLERKAEPIPCCFVRCGRCGRESAKHISPEEAIRDWRFNRERTEHGQADGSDQEAQ